jgi:hypothetical protein
MLSRMLAGSHNCGIGTRAVVAHRRPATNVSATSVLASAKMGSGNCGKCGNWKEHSFWWLVQKKTQYVVDRFLRYLPAPGHERVVRRRPGIANDINEQCTAACLTSNGSGHISAPPRWGAGSRRKSRRSPTTRTATSQAILAAEFFRAGAALLPLCPCIRFAPMPDMGGPETATRKPEVDADH